MENTIRVNDAICIRCGRCVKVCPSQIFVQEKAGAAVTLHKPENCIVCGHCAAACPTGAVEHADFPAEKVHPIDYAALPTPEQVELLLAVRRSNRAFSQRPVPQEYLDRIVAAADRAPTATNARQLGYTLVTDPAMRREIVEYTLGVFGRIVKRLSNPLVRPWLSRLLPGVYRYIPAFRRMRREYAEQGVDRILRGATAVLFIHAPKESRFGAEDANLAYQNASLTAESLGVSQVYMGFVLTAVRHAVSAPSWRSACRSSAIRTTSTAKNLKSGKFSSAGAVPIVRTPYYIWKRPASAGRFHFPDGGGFCTFSTYCRTYSDSCRI